MSYGWATVFTLAAWFAGLVIDVNVRVGDLGLRTVLPVIVMGCCVMKYIPPLVSISKPQLVQHIFMAAVHGCFLNFEVCVLFMLLFRCELD